MSGHKTKPENLLLNLACNLVIPTVILIWLSKDKFLGPLWGLIIALIFPISYGLHDFATRKRTNFISILGFFSVLLSGGLTLAKVGGFWFAVKDAALPALIGCTVLASLRSKTPIVRELFYNEQIIDVPRVDAALDANNARPEFEQGLRKASIWLALTLLATAPVNYFLARAVLTSPAGTPEFNAELGKMHWLALLVIALPSVAMMMWVMWRFLGSLERLTGLTSDEIFKAEKKDTPAPPKPDENASSS
jgi:hypothetical protein